MRVIGTGHGVSPRARDNPAGQDMDVVVPRSIPARAGCPVSPLPGRPCTGVDPRACGGDVSVAAIWPLNLGLSRREPATFLASGNPDSVHFSRCGCLGSFWHSHTWVTYLVTPLE